MGGGAIPSLSDAAQKHDLFDEGQKLAEEILENLASAVIVVDADLVVRFVNYQAETLFRASRSSVVARPLSGLVKQNPDLIELVAKALTKKTATINDNFQININELRLFFNVDLRAFHYGGDVAILMQLSLHEDQEKILDHGFSRSAAGMSAILAHEIKNPLSGIKGAAQLLEHSVGEQDKDLLDVVLRETTRIETLLNKMQAFSDPRPVPLKPLNIHEVVEDTIVAVKAMSHLPNIEFDRNFDPSLPEVYADRDLLQQALANLILNAIEIQGDNAQVIVSTRYRNDFKITKLQDNVAIQLPIEVAIQDFGPGIPDDIKDCLFDPFVSEKPNGTGLGLALVKTYLQKCSGHIDWENNKQGACFKVRLSCV